MNGVLLQDLKPESTIFRGQACALNRKTDQSFMEGPNTFSAPGIEPAVRRGTRTFQPSSQIQVQAPSHNIYAFPVPYPSSSVQKETAVPTPSSHSTFREMQMNQQNNMDSRTSEARSRQIREMYSSLVGYLANRSISSASVVPGSIPPSMRDYRPPPTQSNETDVNGNGFVTSTINGWNDTTWEGGLSDHSSMASTGLPSASLGNTPGVWAMSDVPSSIPGLFDIINPTPTPSSQAPVIDVYGNVHPDSRGSVPASGGLSNTAFPLNYDSHWIMMLHANPDNSNTNFPPLPGAESASASNSCPYNVDPAESLMTEMSIQRGLDDAWLSLAQTYGTEHANAMHIVR